jgi:hypothetical protein
MCGSPTWELLVLVVCELNHDCSPSFSSDDTAALVDIVQRSVMGAY